MRRRKEKSAMNPYDRVLNWGDRALRGGLAPTIRNQACDAVALAPGSRYA